MLLLAQEEEVEEEGSAVEPLLFVVQTLFLVSFALFWKATELTIGLVSQQQAEWRPFDLPPQWVLGTLSAKMGAAEAQVSSSQQFSSV